MTGIQSRLFAASLVCVTICGCASSGVGTPLPGGGATIFLIYAPPDSALGLKIYGVTGDPIAFAPDPSRDNDPARPTGIPADYVAFTTLHHLNGGVNYEADLMTNDGTTLEPIWRFVDDVDDFGANTVVLIKPH